MEVFTIIRKKWTVLAALAWDCGGGGGGHSLLFGWVESEELQVKKKIQFFALSYP